MENIESTGRVELRWPVSGSSGHSISPGGAPTLAEIEDAFAAWVREAKRRGCPSDAPVATFGQSGSFPRPDLMVIWDAGPPKVTQTARTGDVVNYLDDHAYDRDPQSGAGNCQCGRAHEHVKHPHDFRPRASDKRRCVCGRVAAEWPHPTSAVLGKHGPEVDLP